jgi:Ni,Fe-hydrogenase I small subunit
MVITRRQFLKYCSIAAGALGLTSADLLKLKESMAKEGGAPVIWLHGASCSGDSTSLLNTIFYMDGVGLLVTDNVDLEFHETIMNASGTDIGTLGGGYAGATDALAVAQMHLPGAIQNFAGWSTETWADGYESIKLRVGNRANINWYVDAKIYPVDTLLINEFDFCIKFKTSEEQAPYIELDIENQDTGVRTTISSEYPATIDYGHVGDLTDPFELEEIVGPTDWNQVCLRNFPFWKEAVGPPGVRVGTDNDLTLGADGVTVDGPPANLIAAGIDKTWAQIKDDFGTWKVWRARIVNHGDPTVLWPGGSAPCTIYIDEIRVGGITYADESESITFNSEPAASEGPFVLAIEGSVLTGKPKGATLAGEYCEVGPMVSPTDPDETMLHAFLEYAKAASAVLAVGTCASYGGIPAATGSVTGAKGCAAVLKSYGIKTPVINIPGCPAHPDWVVGTLAQYLAKGLAGVSLDSQLRPRDYYAHYLCNGNIDTKCPWLRNYGADQAPGGVGLNADGDSMALAKWKWGAADGVTAHGHPRTTAAAHSLAEGCLGVLGCRGRKTKADCAYRKWNAATTLTPGTLGVNWCVGSRGGCQGCTDPKFPSNSRFYTFI